MDADKQTAYKQVPFVQVTYILISGTGCTCCNHEDRAYGPFKELKTAQCFRDGNISSKLFASQYARTGNHSIGTIEYEQLPDGRIIIGDHVFAGFCEETLDAEICHPRQLGFLFELQNLAAESR